MQTQGCKGRVHDFCTAASRRREDRSVVYCRDQEGKRPMVKEPRTRGMDRSMGLWGVRMGTPRATTVRSAQAAEEKGK